MRTSGDDGGYDAIKITENIAGRNAQGAEAALRHVGVASPVAFNPLGNVMRPTVDFDRQSGTQTRKVEPIRADGMLAAKFVPAWAGLQSSP